MADHHHDSADADEAYAEQAEHFAYFENLEFEVFGLPSDSYKEIDWNAVDMQERIEDAIDHADQDRVYAVMSLEDRQPLIEGILHWYNVNGFLYDIGREVLLGQGAPTPLKDLSDEELIETAEDVIESLEGDEGEED